MKITQAYDKYVLINNDGWYYSKTWPTDFNGNLCHEFTRVIDEVKTFSSIVEAERFQAWIDEECTIYRYRLLTDPLPDELLYKR